MESTCLILGSGQAGIWAAVSMRKSGFKGGVIVIGEEIWRPYERPPLSKAALTQAIFPEPSYLHADADYRTLDIDLRLGVRAECISTHHQRVELSDGGKIGYDHLLIATGGIARRPRIPGGKHALLLRTHDDAAAIRCRLRPGAHVVCMGAGVISLEVASSARQVGAEVTVVEQQGSILGRCVSPEIATHLVDVHRRRGVEVRLGQQIEGIDARANGQFRVSLSGSGSIDADLVVAGIGMERNDSIAEQAHLEVGNGILVDATGRSSTPNVYAAGDVAAFYHPFYEERLRLECWRHAQNHGAHVGRTISGEISPYVEIPWFWTDQHGLNIQVAGLPLRASRTIMRWGEGEHALTALHLSDIGTVEAVTTINNARDMRVAQKMIREKWTLDCEAAEAAAVPLAGLRL